MDKNEVKFRLTKKQAAQKDYDKLLKYVAQWAEYNRTSGHYPDCKEDKCYCDKFFLSKD